MFLHKFICTRPLSLVAGYSAENGSRREFFSLYIKRLQCNSDRLLRIVAVIDAEIFRNADALSIAIQ